MIKNLLRHFSSSYEDEITGVTKQNVAKTMENRMWLSIAKTLWEYRKWAFIAILTAVVCTLALCSYSDYKDRQAAKKTVAEVVAANETLADQLADKDTIEKVNDNAVADTIEIIVDTRDTKDRITDAIEGYKPNPKPAERNLLPDPPKVQPITKDSSPTVKNGDDFKEALVPPDKAEVLVKFVNILDTEIESLPPLGEVA